MDLLKLAEYAWSPVKGQEPALAVEVAPGQKRMDEAEYIERLADRLHALLEREERRGPKALEAAYELVESLLESRELLSGRPRRESVLQFAADAVKYNPDLKTNVRLYRLNELQDEDWKVSPSLEALRAYRNTELETFVCCFADYFVGYQSDLLGLSRW